MVSAGKQQGLAKIGDRHQIGAVRAAKRLVFWLRNLEPVTDFQ
jgi:hypothetical protein